MANSPRLARYSTIPPRPFPLDRVIADSLRSDDSRRTLAPPFPPPTSPAPRVVPGTPEEAAPDHLAPSPFLDSPSVLRPPGDPGRRRTREVPFSAEPMSRSLNQRRWLPSPFHSRCSTPSSKRKTATAPNSERRLEPRAAACRRACEAARVSFGRLPFSAAGAASLPRPGSAAAPTARCFAGLDMRIAAGWRSRRAFDQPPRRHSGRRPATAAPRGERRLERRSDSRLRASARRQFGSNRALGTYGRATRLRLAARATRLERARRCGGRGNVRSLPPPPAPPARPPRAPASRPVDPAPPRPGPPPPRRHHTCTHARAPCAADQARRLSTR